MPNTVIIEGEGKTFQTLKDYVFALGKEKPMISLPGGS